MSRPSPRFRRIPLPPRRPAAPAAPPPAARVAAPALVAPPQPAPEPAVLARVVEIVPCGSPEPVREPVPEPPVVVIDRAEAGRKIQALQRLPLKDREQVIARIPGLGGEMGSQLAFILDKMPAAALRDFIGSLSDDHIGLLQYATIPGA